MQSQQEVIASLLAKDPEQLYAEIGKELYGSTAFPPPSRQLVQLARGWLQNKRAAITEKVCSDRTVRLLTSGAPKSQDQITLVTAIADLIASIVVGVSPITVAVLLVREGLKALCEGKSTSNTAGD
ncbi:MAG: hypothetical protein KGJ80_09835 [Chloroflexota bacterium]|nr:hypothetical protein [Chloroflexota bacterium]